MLVGEFSVGRLSVYQLSDGVERAPRSTWFTGVEPEAWMSAVGARSVDHTFTINYGGFLVSGDGLLTLVDTGLGPDARERRDLEGGGGFVERLRDLGVEVGDVGAIVQTHLHTDHCGWLLQDDGRTPTFPRAAIFVHQREYTYWTSNLSLHERMRPVVERRLLAVSASGLLRLFEDDFAVSASVRVVSSPGHTPGHCCVLIESDGEAALLLGDVAHHPVHLEHYDWSHHMDVDREESMRARRKMVALAAKLGALVTAPHMPILTVGRMVRRDNQLAYVSVFRPEPGS